jgi:hypothetical protein
VLLNQLAGTGRGEDTVLPAPRLVVRASTGPAPTDPAPTRP